MKNLLLFYLLVIHLTTLNFWAQQNRNILNAKKIGGSTSLIAAETYNIPYGKKIKYYHIEEVVPLKFGGYKTIYNIATLKMINTNDLGPNGKRIITPIFEDVDEKININKTIKSRSLANQLQNSDLTVLEENASTVDDEEKKTFLTSEPEKKELILVDQITLTQNISDINSNQSKKTISDISKKEKTYTYINIISTYERIIDKGYVTEDMLKKIGNSYFFENEFEKAEKCYSKLFSMATNIEPEYYYRYSIVLKSIGDISKSDEFLNKFKQLSSLSSRK